MCHLGGQKGTFPHLTAHFVQHTYSTVYMLEQHPVEAVTRGHPHKQEVELTETVLWHS